MNKQSRLVSPAKNHESFMSASRLIKANKEALDKLNTKIEKATTPEGQFGFNAIIQTPEVYLENSQFDFEFDVPFDDDAIANEATITIYGLTQSTANKFKINNTCRITAGYKDNVGIIFEGYITSAKTKWEGVERVTKITAVDDITYNAKLVDEITFSKGTKASTILKSLLDRLGLPVAVFHVARDHTYEDETKVSGNIVENVKTYSEVCSVSTYIYKQQIYCRPLWEGDNLYFYVAPETGMIDSPELFEEEGNHEQYYDTLTGYNIKMILTHQIGTASIIQLRSKSGKGDYRVMSGKHSYDGLSATTEVKVMVSKDTKII